MTGSVLGVDIGGTLAKVAYVAASKNEVAPVCSISRGNGLWLNFMYFETAKVEGLIDFLKEQLKTSSQDHLCVTGGGAYKFAQQLMDELGLPLSRKDEMRSVVAGLTYVINNYESECYTYDLTTSSRQDIPPPPSFPYLLVNIGSGVSILKINGPNNYERVSGTCIGGGTVLGLCKLAIGVKDFDEVIELSRSGRSENLDLSVKELIGDSAGSSLLPHDLLASSFGKLHNNNIAIRKSDFAHSAVRMVSYNLGYLAYLLASLHKCSRVLFGGKYICDHDVTMEAMTEGILFPQVKSFKSKDCYRDLLKRFQLERHASVTPCFLRHDGFLGAVGALQTSD